jgi:hypothetical protein
MKRDLETFPMSLLNLFCWNCTRRGPDLLGLGEIQAGTRSEDHDTGRDGIRGLAKPAAEFAQFLLGRIKHRSGSDRDDQFQGDLEAFPKLASILIGGIRGGPRVKSRAVPTSRFRRPSAPIVPGAFHEMASARPRG